MDNKGFTLVEVIVVAVIVAILAVSSVQLYIGYVNDARKQVLEGVAGNAATFLNAARNLDTDISAFTTPLLDSDAWVTKMGGGDSSTFAPPQGITVVISGNSVLAHNDDDDTSSSVLFK